MQKFYTQLLIIISVIIFNNNSKAQLRFYNDVINKTINFDEWENGLPVGITLLTNLADSLYSVQPYNYTQNGQENTGLHVENYTNGKLNLLISEPIFIKGGSEYEVSFDFKGFISFYNLQLEYLNLETNKNFTKRIEIDSHNDLSNYKTVFKLNNSGTYLIGLSIRRTRSFEEVFVGNQPEVPDVNHIQIDNLNFNNITGKNKIFGLNNLEAHFSTFCDFCLTDEVGFAYGHGLTKKNGTYLIYNNLVGGSGLLNGERVFSSDFLVGRDPLDTFNTHLIEGILVNDSIVQQWYQNSSRVHKVTKEKIDYHRAHFFQENYEMPDEIANWPANIFSSIASNRFAPFHDANSNGIYDPQNGDYPKIKGDVSIFSMYKTEGHDVFEFHKMLYAYHQPNDSMLNNTIFGDYKIYNNTEDNIEDVKFNLSSDIDLVQPFKNSIGTDTSYNMLYVYNRLNEFDSITVKAAIGIEFLNKKMDRTNFFLSASTFGGCQNQISRFMPEFAFNNIEVSSCFSWGHFMPGFAPYKLFPGYPELFSGHIQDPIYSFNNADLRGIAFSESTGTLAPGEFAELSVAYLFAEDFSPNADNLSPLFILRNYAKEAQLFYEEQNPPENITSLSENIMELNVYPNPTNSFLNVNISANIGLTTIEILNNQGNIVFSRIVNQNENVINLQSLQPGIYLCRVSDAEGNTTSKKIILN